MTPTRRTSAKETVEIVTVTPSEARKWLEGNVDNRKLRETRVLYLSRLLQKGEWELTGDAIVFDDQEVLINGQHRLTAVVVADTPARFVILRGVPSKAQEVMDQGLSRSLGDQLHRRGVSYANVISGGLHWLFQMNYIEETGNVHYQDSSMRPSLRELLYLFEENPELEEEAPRLTKLVYYTKVRHGPTLGLYHRLLAIDPGDAEMFFTSWQEGVGLGRNDPIWRLREWCLSDAGSRNSVGRAPTYRYLAVALKAWNYWRENEPVQRLTWNYSGTRREPWPIPR